jgi:hypothetical protein
MTYPPPSGTPDPYQPPQPYGQTNDPTMPYSVDPHAAPASGQPAAYPPPPYPVGGDPYGQNPYGPPAYPGYAMPARTNALAVASLVCSLGGMITCISAPVGVVLGHIAKSQIRQSGEQGEGLATAGLWIGYILTIAGLLFGAVWLAIVIFAIGTANTTT